MTGDLKYFFDVTITKDRKDLDTRYKVKISKYRDHTGEQTILPLVVTPDFRIHKLSL